MRLTVLGPGHPFRGGISRTTTSLVAALANRGHSLAYLTPRRQYPRLLFPGGDDRDPRACPELDCARAVLDPMNPLSWAETRRAAESDRADAWVIRSGAGAPSGQPHSATMGKRP